MTIHDGPGSSVPTIRPSIEMQGALMDEMLSVDGSLPQWEMWPAKNG